MFKLVTEVLDNWASLKDGPHRTLIAIAAATADQGPDARTFAAGHAYLAAKGRVSTRVIGERIAVLLEAGAIELVRDPAPGPTEYRVTTAAI